MIYIVWKNSLYQSLRKNLGWAMDLVFSLCDFEKMVHVCKLLSSTDLSLSAQVLICAPPAYIAASAHSEMHI